MVHAGTHKYVYVLNKNTLLLSHTWYLVPGTSRGGFRPEITIQNRATHTRSRLLRVRTYITAFSCCGMHALPLHVCGNTSYRAVLIHSSPVRI